MNNERWLLTYADMITLLMALFMILFSISAVNVSKYKTLQQVLHRAFSGSVLSDGKSTAQAGKTKGAGYTPNGADVPAVVPQSSQSHSSQQTAGTATESGALREISEFAWLKRELDAYAASHGFSSDVHTTIETRGLVIRVLTDRLLFPSGEASLIPQSFPLLAEIARLLNVDRAHPIAVEGNTDDVPIHGGVFPSNWELSTTRASTVVRFLIGKGLGAPRLSAAGYADQRPIASNSTPAGRARNRRVEIVLQRIYSTEAGPAAAGAR